jgi:hypothetical protein
LKAVFDHAGAYHAIMALGAIGSDSAVEALKKIIITKSNVKTEWGTDSSLSRQKEALITLWNLRGEQEKAFFCGLKADPALEPYKRALNMHCEDDPK